MVKKKRKLKRPAMPGAGRPSVYIRPAKVSFVIESSILGIADRAAKSLGVSRSDVIKLAVMEYLKNHAALWA